MIKNILIAEDDPITTFMISEFLESKSYFCETAENSKQAIDLINKNQFHLIISDIEMPPGIDGVNMMIEVKKKYPEIDFIIMTSNTFKYDYNDIISFGASDFIIKPINLKELEAKIKRIIKERCLLSEIEKAKEQEKLLAIKTIEAEMEKKKAIELKYLYEKVEKFNNEMMKEQESAEKIFNNILNSNSLLKSSNIKFVLSPMSVFNGDLLAVSVTPFGEYHILIGDFTGHGIQASIGSLPVCDIFYDMTSSGFSISDIVLAINKKLNSILPTGIFLAACLIGINKKCDFIQAYNGGIPDVLIISKNGGIKSRIQSKHLPLGIIENSSLDKNLSINPIEKGDKIFLYSDGLIESLNLNNEMFGQERLEYFFDNTKEPANVFYEIKKDLDEFRKGKEQNDDITIMEFLCEPLPYSEILNYNSLTEPNLEYNATFQLFFEISNEKLADFDPIPHMNKIFMQIPNLSSNIGDILTIFSELYNNALDHGVLNLNSELKKTQEGFIKFYEIKQKILNDLKEGYIKINIDYTNLRHIRKVKILIEDSGNGFDYKSTILKQPEDILFYGKGISLLRSLCKELSYYGKGNIVKVEYEFS